MTAEMDSKFIFASETPNLFPGDAFFELAQELSGLISRRAYELYESRGFAHGHDREDWLQAVSEILLNVPVDVMETETELTIRADVPGFGEKDIEVRVAPRLVCIAGKREEVSEQKQVKAIYSERRSNQIFRVLELPSEIDPDRVNATVSGGILEIQLLRVGLARKIQVLVKAASA
jgi:HSP20 family protein